MIILPAEILTSTGWKDLKNLNIINEKICIYDSFKQHLLYQKPLGIYIQPLQFRFYSYQNKESLLLYDESHLLLKIDEHIHKINKNQLGSIAKWFEEDFLQHATYDQCVDAIKDIFHIDKHSYQPFLTGSCQTDDFAVANKIQILALHANANCTIHTNLSGTTCILNEQHEKRIPFGPLPPVKTMYGINITTSTGNYVVRTVKSNGICEAIYSMYIC